MKLSPFLFLFSTILSFASASILNPPVLPLAVRNPYLSLWMPNARDFPWKSSPMFWTGESLGFEILLWDGGTRTVYPLVGVAWEGLYDGGDNMDMDGRGGYKLEFPEWKGWQFDAVSTNATYVVGGRVVEVVFVSPITREDIFRQGLPASYVEIVVGGRNGGEGSADKGNEEEEGEGEGEGLSVYVEVDGRWVSHESSTSINWEFSSNEGMLSCSVQREEQLLYTEMKDRAEWGTFHISTWQDDSVSFRAGSASKVRKQFAQTGVVGNHVDYNFRSIGGKDRPVFAYTKRFSGKSKVSKGSQSFMLTLAYVQDPIVQFKTAEGYKEWPPYWTNHVHSTHEMLLFHLKDYPTASSLGYEYASAVTSDAERVSGKSYADIVSLAARQVLGATYFSGTSSNPVLFLKEISSNGNFQTVDVIFPSMPFFLYTNPEWLGYLLEPLLMHQEAGLYPNKYSIHDLGKHFPNATGHPDGQDEPMPLEECGNMLIMALAYVQALIGKYGEKDGREAASHWIKRFGSYWLWEHWTGYLVEYGLVPDLQLSTDDFAGRLANQTNLAVKALIGIRAMAHLAALTYLKDSAHYLNISNTYLPLWANYALSRDKSHTKLAYHWYGSWGTLYNLYNDALLCFHIPPNKKNTDPLYAPFFTTLEPNLYKLQSRWYSAVIQTYGLPLDTRHLYTKSDWALFAAAISSPYTREQIINSLGKWLNETDTDRPMSDLFETEGKGGWGGGIQFMARPVVGGVFSLLALEGACGGRGLEGVERLFEGDGEDGDGGGEKESTLGKKVKAGVVEGVVGDIWWGEHVLEGQGGEEDEAPPDPLRLVVQVPGP